MKVEVMGSNLGYLLKSSLLYQQNSNLQFLIWTKKNFVPKSYFFPPTPRSSVLERAIKEFRRFEATSFFIHTRNQALRASRIRDVCRMFGLVVMEVMTPSGHLSNINEKEPKKCMSKLILPKYIFLYISYVLCQKIKFFETPKVLNCPL